jgi:hypothetical protein
MPGQRVVATRERNFGDGGFEGRPRLPSQLARTWPTGSRPRSSG